MTYEIKILLGFILVACLTLAPKQSACSINQEVIGADSLTVGTPFTLLIHSDKAISSVSTPDSLDGFAIVSSKAANPGTFTWEIRVVPLKIGALSFPRLPVATSDLSAVSDSTDGFRVYVLSTLAEGDTLLRDIKPLIRYPRQLNFWVYILLFIITLTLGIYLIVGLLRNKRKLKIKRVSPPELVVPKAIADIEIPAWKKALEELELLIAAHLIEKGELVLYHFRLSEILRKFLESRYKFPALEMTTSEINAFFSKQHIARSTDLLAILRFCDMVKFAKTQPTNADVEAHTEQLRAYLLSFKLSNEVKTHA